MRRIFVTGIICLMAPLLSKAQHKDTTLKEIRILGQRPLVEKKLDRTIVHVDALLANTGGQAWQVLENTPGVTVDEDGTITLNGKSGILIMIDDRPTYMDGTTLVNYLKSLPASTLAQVELLSHPPARYPASGNGIIILRTKRAEQKGFHAQWTSNGTLNPYVHTSQNIDVQGQEGPWQLTARAGYAYNRNYFVSDRYRVIDGVGTDTQDNSEDSWAQDISYGASVEHKGRRTSWGGIFSGRVGPYHELGHYQDSFSDATGKTDSLTDVRSHFHNLDEDVDANAHVFHTWTHEGRSLSADADFVHYRTGGHQDEVSTTTVPGSTGSGVYELIDDQPFTAYIYSLKTDYTDKFGKRFFLEAGAQETYSIRRNQGIYTDGTPPSLAPDTALNNTFRYDEQIRSAYLTLRHETKRFAVQAGLRLENTWGQGDSTISYTNLFPSAHALWKVNDDGQLTLAYGRRIERPDYGDLNPSRFYFDRNTYFSGNTALQPAFEQSLEAAYTYRGRYTLTAEYASNRGTIHQVFIAEGNTFYYYAINMDRSVFTRISLDAATPLTAHWSTNLHVDAGIQHYRSVLPGNALLDKSLPYISASGNTRYTWGHGWSAEASGHYQSSLLVAQFVLQPMGNLNLALRRKFWSDRASVTVQGIDLLHTWINARTIYLSNALAHFHNDFHHRAVSLTFTCALGKSGIKTTEHRTGVEGEKTRL
jgi:outer membrane receptor protein involved in Fe transport